MTEISLVLSHDTYIFECCGHTGYGRRGEDILCSAVSVLCYALLDYLNEMKSSGRLKTLISDFRDGDVRIEFTPADDSDKALLESVQAIAGGFRLLGENFPEHIDAAL